MWSVRSDKDVHEWKRLTRAKVENRNRQEFGTGGIRKNFVKDWTKWRKEDKFFCASVFVSTNVFISPLEGILLIYFMHRYSTEIDFGV